MLACQYRSKPRWQGRHFGAVVKLNLPSPDACQGFRAFAHISNPLNDRLLVPGFIYLSCDFAGQDDVNRVTPVLRKPREPAPSQIELAQD